MRPEPPELPDRKPVADMTAEERQDHVRELRRITRKELAELNRPRRERKLRAGLARPRNRREMELFCADYKDGEQAGDR